MPAPKRTVTAETREKMRQAKLGKKLTPEHRKKIGDAHRGMKRSPETRARMSEAARRWYPRPSPSAETRAKRSASMMGHIISAETRAKISAANRGRKPVITEERNRKASETLRRRIWRPEWSLAISAAKTGKPFTEAHKAALRAAWVRRKARDAVHR